MYKMKTIPGGLWPVMLTPFTEKGKIDFQGLEELIEFYISAGASGLFSNCLSSEMYSLSAEERYMITRYTVRVSNGRVPVISTGTFSESEKENAEFSARIFDTGIEAVVINSNQLCREDEDDGIFLRRLNTFMNLTGDIPLGIYECPVPYKRQLSGRILTQIAQSGRFLYYKETSCNNHVIKDKLSAIENTGLSLFNANTPTALQSLRDGAAGLSPIGANFYPELYSFLSSFYHNIEQKDEIGQVNRFLGWNDITIHYAYPFSAKWFLKKRGLNIGDFTRTAFEKPGSRALNNLNDLYTSYIDLKGRLEEKGLKSNVVI